MRGKHRALLLCAPIEMACMPAVAVAQSIAPAQQPGHDLLNASIAWKPGFAEGVELTLRRRNRANGRYNIHGLHSGDDTFVL